LRCLIDLGIKKFVRPEEKKALESALLTIADSRGNWYLGWQQICELAEVDPEKYPPPFKDHPLDGAS
jgi:hypothetical protein